MLRLNWKWDPVESSEMNLEKWIISVLRTLPGDVWRKWRPHGSRATTEADLQTCKHINQPDRSMSCYQITPSSLHLTLWTLVGHSFQSYILPLDAISTSPQFWLTFSWQIECIYRSGDRLRPVPIMLQHPGQVRIQADQGQPGGGEWIQQVASKCQL